jgi:ABC-type transport system involved in multi-copper enzyme maturation permease subunit
VTAIDLTGVTKQYGNVTALQKLDMTVKSGEVFGFLGPNGAGKSTTIDILLDFIRPTAGNVQVLGMDAQDETVAVRERTGVLPENFGPLVTLAFTNESVAGKRASHELTVLLGLPFSRRDIIVGSILLGLLTGASLDIGLFVGSFLIVTVLALIFVSIGLGISAGVRSTTAASAGAFGAFLLFVFQVWSLIPDAVLYIINGFDYPDANPVWEQAFNQLSPFASVRNLADAVWPSLADTFPVAASSVPANPPVFMTPWFAAIVILVWLVGPVALGYLKLARRDL